MIAVTLLCLVMFQCKMRTSQHASLLDKWQLNALISRHSQLILRILIMWQSIHLRSFSFLIFRSLDKGKVQLVCFMHERISILCCESGFLSGRFFCHHLVVGAVLCHTRNSILGGFLYAKKPLLDKTVTFKPQFKGRGLAFSLKNKKFKIASQQQL